MAPIHCFQACRHGPYEVLKFELTIRMGKKSDLNYFEHARGAGLSIFLKTAFGLKWSEK